MSYGHTARENMAQIKAQVFWLECPTVLALNSPEKLEVCHGPQAPHPPWTLISVSPDQ